MQIPCYDICMFTYWHDYYANFILWHLHVCMTFNCMCTLQISIMQISIMQQWHTDHLTLTMLSTTLGYHRATLTMPPTLFAMWQKGKLHVITLQSTVHLVNKLFMVMWGVDAHGCDQRSSWAERNCWHVIRYYIFCGWACAWSQHNCLLRKAIISFRGGGQ